jgi:hypothetical protein
MKSYRNILSAFRIFGDCTQKIWILGMKGFFISFSRDSTWKIEWGWLIGPQTKQKQLFILFKHEQKFLSDNTRNDFCIQTSQRIWIYIRYHVRYETGSPVGSMDEKNWGWKSRASVSLSQRMIPEFS